MKFSKRKFAQGFLKDLDRSVAYNDWLIRKFSSSLKGNILEIGSGVGGITSRLVAMGFDVTPSDLDKVYLKILRKKFNDKPKVLDIIKVNFNSIRKNSFSTIMAINVIEHLEDDELAIGNIYKLLRKDGNLIILVPAHKQFLGSYDRILEHHRRYTAEDLSLKLKDKRFKVERVFYINKVAGLGWFFNSRVLKRSALPKSQLKLTNFLVPFLDLCDKVIPFNFGLSLICIAKKK